MRRAASAGSKRASAALPLRRIVMTPMRWVSRSKECRASTIAAALAILYPVRSSCCTPTNFMMGVQVTALASDTAPPISRRPTCNGSCAGRTLPFVAGGVSDDPTLRRAVGALLEDLAHPLDTLEFEQALHDLTVALLAVAGLEAPARIANHAAVTCARDFIEANLDRSLQLEDLERATGYDRWQLSRDFRALLGASPWRFLIFRRLDRARRMMTDGQCLADVAHACGFSDQSHFTRHFKKAFGMTPKAWVAAHKRSVSRQRPGLEHWRMQLRSIYSPAPSRGWLPWGLLAPVVCLVLAIATQTPFGALARGVEVHRRRRRHDRHVRSDRHFGRAIFGVGARRPRLGAVLIERRSLATIGLTQPGGGRTFLGGHLAGVATISAVVV